MERAVDILPEQHHLPIHLGYVHKGPGGVARPVMGDDLSIPDFYRVRIVFYCDINGKRMHVGTIPGGGGNLTVAGFEIRGF
jgi:hypothetical protein